MWTPQAIAGLVTAITGLVTAVTATIVAVRAHGKATTAIASIKKITDGK